MARPPSQGTVRLARLSAGVGLRLQVALSVEQAGLGGGGRLLDFGRLLEGLLYLGQRGHVYALAAQEVLHGESRSGGHTRRGLLSRRSRGS